MSDHKTGEVCQPGHSAGDARGLRIEVQYLAYAAKLRRHDWAIAKATVHTAAGTSGGHLICDYADKGRLSVHDAPMVLLTGETKAAILEEYHRCVVQDRYHPERALYGLWTIATCNDRNEPSKHYIVHRVRQMERCEQCGHVRQYGTDEYGTCDSYCRFKPHTDTSRYQRIAAKTLADALQAARASDSPGFYTYGIMAADYAEARAAGITFLKGMGC